MGTKLRSFAMIAGTKPINRVQGRVFQRRLMQSEIGVQAAFLSEWVFAGSLMLKSSMVGPLLPFSETSLSTHVWS